MQPEAVAAAVGLAIKGAIAPLIADVAVLTERLAKLERTPGPIGPPGPAGGAGAKGADGLGFDDLNVTFDGDRTLLITFSRGDQMKAFPIPLPILRYRGVYQAGAAYVRGDIVTRGGSAWHCDEPTSSTPNDGAAGWRLMVKHGRDAPQLAGVR